VKAQKNEIWTQKESRTSSRPNVLCFLPNAHFYKQLPTYKGAFAFALTQEAKFSEEIATEQQPPKR